MTSEPGAVDRLRVALRLVVSTLEPALAEAEPLLKAASASDDGTSTPPGLGASLSAVERSAAAEALERAQAVVREAKRARVAICMYKQPLGDVSDADSDEQIEQIETTRRARQTSKEESIAILQLILNKLKESVSEPMDKLCLSSVKLRDAVTEAARAAGVSLDNVTLTATSASWMDNLGVPKAKQGRVVGRAVKVLAAMSREALGDDQSGCQSFRVPATWVGGSVVGPLDVTAWSANGLATRRAVAASMEATALARLYCCRSCNAVAEAGKCAACRET